MNGMEWNLQAPSRRSPYRLGLQSQGLLSNFCLHRVRRLPGIESPLVLVCHCLKRTLQISMITQAGGPWGQIISGRVSDRCVEMLSKDEDLAESFENDTAKRMDERPGEKFIFPDLSPERYQQVKERKGRKPS
jgi:hypothetical protein